MFRLRKERSKRYRRAGAAVRPSACAPDIGDASPVPAPVYVCEIAPAWSRMRAEAVRGARSNGLHGTCCGSRATVKALEAGGKLQVESVVLPDGEAYKKLDVLQAVWDKALECKMDRGTTFVALGGGVIGDMTGFAASCYQRGVYFVQVPTTVMSQVDSSVGGKTGVNHPLGKNMIGAFYQPQSVIIDSDTLMTLPDRELASGYSEIIKYGLIRDDALFGWLEKNMDKLLARDPEAIAYAIERSCINKAEVVAADERETMDMRATLNLGHTFGHAIENFAGYGVWLHGEAVATGTLMAADLSCRMGWIEKDLNDRIIAIMKLAKLPTEPPKGMTAADFMELMSVDKKVADGKLRLVLLKGPLGGEAAGDSDALYGQVDAAVDNNRHLVATALVSSVKHPCIRLTYHTSGFTCSKHQGSGCQGSSPAPASSPSFPMQQQ
eukprot:144860-Chlamydomonas_euryale.AAC.6